MVGVCHIVNSAKLPCPTFRHAIVGGTAFWHIKHTVRAYACKWRGVAFTHWRILGEAYHISSIAKFKRTAPDSVYTFTKYQRIEN